MDLPHRLVAIICVQTLALSLATTAQCTEDGPLLAHAQTVASRTTSSAEVGRAAPAKPATVSRLHTPERFKLRPRDVSAVPRARAQEARLPALGARSVPAPAGLGDARLVSDDLLSKAVSTKRLDLLSLVDEEHQQISLGVSREGYLGVQVRMRPRNR